MSHQKSPFLDRPDDDLISWNEHAFALLDSFPVSRGHTLVIPKRVRRTYWDCSLDEQRAMWALVEECRNALDILLKPDGYNVGFNAGEAAGQTVMHCHIHIIPRYKGDVEDPRGGVRHVIPKLANYLK